jgi:hypothetical protein
MRALAIMAAAAMALTGCGSFDPGLQAGIQQALGNVLGTDEAPTEQPSFDEVIAMPFASIALSVAFAPDAPPALLAANSVVNGRVWYVDAQRRGIILEGARVSGTRGMVQDVLSAMYLARDPLVTPTLPDAWPDQTLVIQHARNGLGQDYSRALRCRIAQVGVEMTELYQRVVTLMHLSESCTSGGITFRNDHWIDPNDGRMWKTRQWMGPQTGHVEVVVIRPFSG